MCKWMIKMTFIILFVFFTLGSTLCADFFQGAHNHLLWRSALVPFGHMHTLPSTIPWLLLLSHYRYRRRHVAANFFVRKRNKKKIDEMTRSTWIISQLRFAAYSLFSITMMLFVVGTHSVQMVDRYNPVHWGLVRPKRCEYSPASFKLHFARTTVNSHKCNEL